MQTCPQHHLKTGKICRECGYVFPFAPGDILGALQITQIAIQHSHYHMYHCQHQGKPYTLWEVREILQPEYREQYVAALNTLAFAHLPEILHFSVDDTYPESNLLYLVFDGTLYQELETLTQQIESQGILSTEHIFIIIKHLLETLISLEANHWCLNTLHSQYIYVDQHKSICFPGFLAYAQELKGKVLSPVVFNGFSPPEQIRSGRLFYETDRYGLAMTLFHLLSGLSPALWYPDIPSLGYYRHTWGPHITAFYQQLLQPVKEVSAETLYRSWMALESELNKCQPKPEIQKELSQFHTALAYYQQNELNPALDILIGMQRSVWHNPHISRYIARALWQKQLKTEAMAWYGSAVRREPLGIFYQEVGECYESEKQNDKALQAFAQAVQRIPYVPDAYNGMGRCVKARDNFKLAKTWFETSLKIQPNWEAYNQLETICKQQFPDLNFTTQALHNPRKTSLQINPHHPLYTQAKKKQNQFLSLNNKVPGDFLGDYQIEKVLRERDLDIGRRTYLATQNNTYYFIKEYLLTLSGTGAFYREAGYLKLFEHPSIPQLVTSFEEDNSGYLVLPYYSAPSLETYLQKQGVLPETEVRLIFEQALQLICYLQTQNIVHADIKPENLLWDPQTQKLYLIDFDIAVHCDPEHPEQHISSGVTIGFAPPEQVQYKTVNWTTDIFALALTCLNLLSSFSPKLFYRHQKQRYHTFKNLNMISKAFARYLDNLIICDLTQRQNTISSPEAILSAFQKKVKPTAPLALTEDKKSLGKWIQDVGLYHKEQLSELISTRPSKSSDAKIDYLLASVYVRHQNWTMACKYFDQAIAKDPQWILPYYAKSAALADDKKTSEAIALLKKSLDYCSNEPQAYILMAKCFVQQKKYKFALELYHKALRLQPLNKKLCLELAHLYIQLGNFELARKLCYQALKVAPSARAYQLLQMIAGVQENYSAAIEFGEKAAVARPHSLEVQYDLGLSYYRGKMPLKALKQFEHCLHLNSEHLQSRYYLASTLFELNRWDEAQKHFKKIQHHPEIHEAVTHKLQWIAENTSSSII